jgi:hypothetical protein
MSNVVNLSSEGSVSALDPEIQASIVLRGDLSGLSEDQKKTYYLYRCRQVGLDPAAKPFDLLVLNGKQILYANAGATQQLCSIHKLSTQITHRERVDGIYIVSVRCTGADGRVSENQGAVDVGNVTGEKLANAILKATTKAIRRSVLAHCGLGMLDETEVETIPEARVQPLVVSDSVAPVAIQKPAVKGIPFLLPNGEAHTHYANYDDLVGGILDMVEAIHNSKKFNAGEKLEKINSLEEANAESLLEIETKHEALAEVFNRGINTVRAFLEEETKKL